tara:strand:- start:2149 stop:2271 length:123 start_codon:yes stop_codon:yes gene_type:complete
MNPFQVSWLMLKEEKKNKESKECHECKEAGTDCEKAGCVS